MTIYGSSLLSPPLPFLAGGGGGLGEDIIFQDRQIYGEDLPQNRTRHGAKSSGVVVYFFMLWQSCWSGAAEELSFPLNSKIELLYFIQHCTLSAAPQVPLCLGMLRWWTQDCCQLRPERLGRGGSCWLLKLRRRGTNERCPFLVS